MEYAYFHKVQLTVKLERTHRFKEILIEAAVEDRLFREYTLISKIMDGQQSGDSAQVSVYSIQVCRYQGKRPSL